MPQRRDLEQPGDGHKNDGGKDWLVVSPDGFFDGSKGAWRYVSYRSAGTLQLVEDEATLQRFYRPGLLGLLLKGQKLTK